MCKVGSGRVRLGLGNNSSTPGRMAIIDVLIIIALWCIGILVVNPIGNFPLNDDWSYGLTVKHFIERGDFRPTGYISMPLLTNVLWGSLFCIPKGFSFTALRFSTLTLSLGGILAVFLLFQRDLCQPRWLAVVTALTLAFNPLYFALSNTFMTDVVYIAMTVASALFFARSLRNDSDLDLIIGTILAIAAILSRQLAISVPLAFAFAWTLKHGFTKRSLLRAAIPSVCCLGVLLTFQRWLAESGRLPVGYYGKIEDLLTAISDPKTLALSVVRNSFVGLLYLGLFLLPVLIFAVADIWGSHRKLVAVLLSLTIATMALGSGVVAIHGFSPAVTSTGSYPSVHLMPMSGNVLMKSGIGPLMLRDNWVAGKYAPVLPELPLAFWLVITAMSVVGAGFLITTVSVRAIDLLPRLWFGDKTGENEAVGIFFLLAAVIYLLPLFLSSFIDRYLLPPVPLLAAAITCFSGSASSPRFHLESTKILRFSAVVALAASYLFAVSTTRDYLTWNRARWKALNYLLKNKLVDARNIDGGLEFNGLYMYDSHYQFDSRKGWWWVQGDAYRVCFGPMSGYEVTKEYSYRNWLPPYIGKVVVLEKIP